MRWCARRAAPCIRRRTPACRGKPSYARFPGSTTSRPMSIRRSHPASGAGCMAETARVLVVGATSAIAQAVARIYAARGARLHLLARDGVKLEAVRQDLLARGAAQATGAVADLAEVSRHADLVDEAAAALGGIDVALIAHGGLPDQALCQSSFAEARRALDVNFTSAASLAHELANRFEKRRHGAIVAIGSVAGDRGRQSNYVYGAAKGALALYLQGLRHRLHGAGVKVLTVKPGFVDTPMT